jgi:16S rRNA (uracil1498-N3)-methyltransferase
MSERFFSAEPTTAQRVTLDGTEAHHLLHVMRATVGEAVTLFDDTGAEFLAVVESLDRSSATLQVLERREVSRELAFSLAIGVTLPKGERQKWLVEKLTELGVTALTPLVTERGVAQPVASALERLRRTVIEASKQCGRNRLMRIHQPQQWFKWLAARDGHPDETHCLVAHPGGKPLPELDLTRALPMHIAIGPEGGFTDAEIAAAVDAGWQPVDLGPRILRVETAAVALAAAIVLSSRACSPDSA